MAKKPKDVARKATNTQKSKKFDTKKLKQTHGATASPSPDKYLTGYDTADASVYRAKLDKMEGTELYDHAVNIGEVPIDDRTRLISRLTDRFAHVQAANIPRQSIMMNISPAKEEKLRRILAGIT